jgi:ERF superfamily
MSKDLHAAVLAIQSEIGTLQKNAINPHFKSRYISLDSLVEHVQPLLTKHGLIWTCEPTHQGGSEPYLEYSLIHAETGQVRTNMMPLLLDKQNAQGLGSALTYARRYALCAVLNIVADVDDDGEKATRTTKTMRGVAGLPLSEQDFASKVRATGMKGNDIRAWLLTEGGFSEQNLGAPGDLKSFLNNKLNGVQQQALLAWANGS